MTPDMAMALLPELALFALAVVVLLSGAARSYVGQVPRSEVPRGPAGWTSLIGLLVVFGLTFLVPPDASLLRESFVQDSLALFAKRLFIASAALSLLGSLTLRADAVAAIAGSLVRLIWEE